MRSPRGCARAPNGCACARVHVQVSMCVFACVHVCVCKCPCVRVYLYMYICACVCVRVRTYMHASPSVRVRACVCFCPCTCMHACMLVRSTCVRVADRSRIVRRCDGPEIGTFHGPEIGTVPEIGSVATKEVQVQAHPASSLWQQAGPPSGAGST